jgi:hypothetical protein
MSRFTGSGFFEKLLYERNIDEPCGECVYILRRNFVTGHMGRVM